MAVFSGIVSFLFLCITMYASNDNSGVSNKNLVFYATLTLFWLVISATEQIKDTIKNNDR